MGPYTPQDTIKLKGYKFEKDNMALKMFKALKFEKWNKVLWHTNYRISISLNSYNYLCTIYEL